MISDKWPLKVQCTFVSGCICCRIIRGGRDKSGRFLYITVIEQECSMTNFSGRSGAGGQTPQVEWTIIDRCDKSKPPKNSSNRHNGHGLFVIVFVNAVVEVVIVILQEEL